MTDPTPSPSTVSSVVQAGKDPTTYAVLTYLWVLILSSWGGVVSFLRKRREGVARPFNFAELIGEICTSAFAGVVTFYLAEYATVPPLMTAAMVAISGHMGGRAIFLFEKWAERRFPAAAVDNQNVTE